MSNAPRPIMATLTVEDDWKTNLRISCYPQDGYDTVLLKIVQNGLPMQINLAAQPTIDWHATLQIGMQYSVEVIVANGDGLTATTGPIKYPVRPEDPKPDPVPLTMTVPPYPPAPSYGPPWANLWDGVWHFCIKTARWSDGDSQRHGNRKRIEFHLEGEGKTCGMDFSDRADVYMAVMMHAPLPSSSNYTSQSQWKGPDGKVRTAWQRAANWGRYKDLSGQSYLVPFTWNLMLDDVWYEVPQMWLMTDTLPTGAKIARAYSNWGEHDYIEFTGSAAKSITVYAYRGGNPLDVVALKIDQKPSTDSKGNAVGLTVCSVYSEIPLSSEQTPGAFVPEFNWRLAVYRDNHGWARAIPGTPGGSVDGWLGWAGGTPLNWDELLEDKGGTSQGGYGKEPLVWFPLSDDNVIKGTVVDMFGVDVSSAVETPEYAQSFTVTNRMANQQNLKTSDYAHAVAETWTWSWGYKWGMNQKVTIKWETDLAASVLFSDVKAKFTFQVEAGFTEEWNEQQTHTITDTKTMTMGGQTVALPPLSSARVDVLVSKVEGSGHYGKAVRIDEMPLVNVQPSSADSNSDNRYWVAQLTARLHLDKLAAAIGMTSVRSGYKRQDGKSFAGLFVVNVQPFSAKFQTAGDVKIVPIDYIRSSEAPELTAGVVGEA